MWQVRARGFPIISLVAVAGALFVFLLAGSQTVEDLRPVGTQILKQLGINDPLRYYLHMGSAEVALRLGAADIAINQFRKAEPHAVGTVRRSTVLAGYGEALITIGAQRQAEVALRQALVLDPENKRASQLLYKLQQE